MFNLICNITISDPTGSPSYNFIGVTEVEINSSWDTITDTAIVTFPRKLEFKNKYISRGVGGLIKRGMLVNIELGYASTGSADKTKVVNRFKGYVRSVNASVPVTIECEDEAFNMKKGEITKSYKDVTLKQLLSDVFMGVTIGSQPDEVVGLGPFRISKATKADVLYHLKHEYHLENWFRDGKLFIGLAYWPAFAKEHKIVFEKSVITHNLQYRNKEEIFIKLNVENRTPENKREEYVFGDQDGDNHSLHFYNTKKSDIERLSKEALEKMKFTGYRGSFTTFGVPVVNHGDIINLLSNEYPERDGRYRVKSVRTTFGNGGYRQEIELDIKVEL